MGKITVKDLHTMTEVVAKLASLGINFEARLEAGEWIIIIN